MSDFSLPSLAAKPFAVVQMMHTEFSKDRAGLLQLLDQFDDHSVHAHNVKIEITKDVESYACGAAAAREVRLIGELQDACQPLSVDALATELRQRVQASDIAVDILDTVVKQCAAAVAASMQMHLRLPRIFVETMLRPLTAALADSAASCVLEAMVQQDAIPWDQHHCAQRMRDAVDKSLAALQLSIPQTAVCAFDEIIERDVYSALGAAIECCFAIVSTDAHHIPHRSTFLHSLVAVCCSIVPVAVERSLTEFGYHCSRVLAASNSSLWAASNIAYMAMLRGGRLRNMLAVKFTRRWFDDYLPRCTRSIAGAMVQSLCTRQLPVLAHDACWSAVRGLCRQSVPTPLAVPHAPAALSDLLRKEPTDQAAAAPAILVGHDASDAHGIVAGQPEPQTHAGSQLTTPFPPELVQSVRNVISCSRELRLLFVTEQASPIATPLAASTTVTATVTPAAVPGAATSATAVLATAALAVAAPATVILAATIVTSISAVVTAAVEVPSTPTVTTSSGSAVASTPPVSVLPASHADEISLPAIDEDAFRSRSIAVIIRALDRAQQVVDGATHVFNRLLVHLQTNPGKGSDDMERLLRSLVTSVLDSANLAIVLKHALSERYRLSVSETDVSSFLQERFAAICTSLCQLFVNLPELSETITPVAAYLGCSTILRSAISMLLDDVSLPSQPTIIALNATEEDIWSTTWTQAASAKDLNDLLKHAADEDAADDDVPADAFDMTSRHGTARTLLHRDSLIVAPATGVSYDPEASPSEFDPSTTTSAVGVIDSNRNAAYGKVSAKIDAAMAAVVDQAVKSGVPMLARAGFTGVTQEVRTTLSAQQQVDFDKTQPPTYLLLRRVTSKARALLMHELQRSVSASQALIEVLFLVDNSGSMGAAALNNAMTALTVVMEALEKTEHRTAVWSFSGRVHVQLKGFNDELSVARGQLILEALKPRYGGTQLDSVVQAACAWFPALPAVTEDVRPRIRLIMLITDGLSESVKAKSLHAHLATRQDLVNSLCVVVIMPPKPSESDTSPQAVFNLKHFNDITREAESPDSQMTTVVENDLVQLPLKLVDLFKAKLHSTAGAHVQATDKPLPVERHKIHDQLQKIDVPVGLQLSAPTSDKVSVFVSEPDAKIPSVTRVCPPLSGEKQIQQELAKLQSCVVVAPPLRTTADAAWHKIIHGAKSAVTADAAATAAPAVPAAASTLQVRVLPEETSRPALSPVVRAICTVFEQSVFDSNRATRRMPSNTGDDINVPGLIENVMSQGQYTKVFLSRTGGLVRDHQIGFLIDTSRSMSGPALLGCRDALFAMIEALSHAPVDLSSQLCIFTIGKALKLVKASDQFWDDSCKALLLSATSSATDDETRLAEGIDAVRIYMQGLQTRGTRRLFVLTDGYGSRGNLAHTLMRCVQASIEVIAIGTGIECSGICSKFQNYVLVPRMFMLAEGLRKYFEHAGKGGGPEIGRLPPLAEESDETDIRDVFKSPREYFRQECERLHTDITAQSNAEMTSSAGLSLDLLFILDITGSMHPYWAQAKAHIATVAKQIQDEYSGKTGKSATIRIGLVTYSDHDAPSDAVRVQAVDFAKDTTALQTMLNGANLCYGWSDGPECMSGGLRKALTLDWKAAARVAIIVCDAPCHGYPEFHNLAADKMKTGCCGDIRQHLRDLRSKMVHLMYTPYGHVRHGAKIWTEFGKTYDDDSSGFKLRELSSSTDTTLFSSIMKEVSTLLVERFT
eukprot:TRINITY_DN6154_c0_g4_i1.p1 TRINITY_DN6154_c0_g4~~TRINITY_DN6154_c0_g4_i1.p1  ORF type:complete len:1811 (-),score=336.50 TRINITY_DN6154_c0_g4_i1:48-5222(-)